MFESDERVKKQVPIDENPRYTPRSLRPLVGRLRIWIGITLSIVFLYFAVRKVPLSDLVASLADAELTWLAAALVLQIIALLPRAKRWLVILEPEGSFRDAFSSQNIGYLFNNIFPLRVGELARILVMSRACRIPIVRVGTSVILERVLDVIFVTLGLVIALSGIMIPDGYLSGAR
ncbi:MAG: lysylphosphatidylglycerol synthase transmembrane domain-containing protein, partial [Anaerolineales bacterium]